MRFHLCFAALLARRPGVSRALGLGLLLAGVAGVVVPAATQTPGTPTVQWAAAEYAVTRTDTTVTIKAKLSAAASETVTVQYSTSDAPPATATAGQDFVSKSDTLVFPVGTTEQPVQITLIPNSETETQTFFVNLSNPQKATLGAPSATTIKIQGPSAATVAFESSGWTCSEYGATATVTVRMDNSGGPLSSPVSVLCSTTTGGSAVAGVDYEPNSQTLTWQPNEVGKTKTFTVVILDDADPEPTRTVNLALTSPMNATLGAQPTAVLSILDDDQLCAGQ